MNVYMMKTWTRPLQGVGSMMTEDWECDDITVPVKFCTQGDEMGNCPSKDTFRVCVKMVSLCEVGLNQRRWHLSCSSTGIARLKGPDFALDKWMAFKILNGCTLRLVMHCQ